MKFQKALREAIVKNKKAMKEEIEKSNSILLEANLRDVINDWPMIVANEYIAENSTDDSKRKASEKIVAQYVNDISLDNNSKWVGDFKSDFFAQIANKNYGNYSSIFEIDGKKVIVKEGIHSFYIDYLSSPTAKNVYNIVLKTLKNQKDTAPSTYPVGAADIIHNPPR